MGLRKSSRRTKLSSSTIVNLTILQFSSGAGGDVVLPRLGVERRAESPPSLKLQSACSWPWPVCLVFSGPPALPVCHQHKTRIFALAFWKDPNSTVLGRFQRTPSISGCRLVRGGSEIRIMSFGSPGGRSVIIKPTPYVYSEPR